MLTATKSDAASINKFPKPRYCTKSQTFPTFYSFLRLRLKPLCNPPFISTLCQHIENGQKRSGCVTVLWTSLTGDMQRIFPSFHSKNEAAATVPMLFYILLLVLYKMGVSFLPMSVDCHFSQCLLEINT